MASDRGKRKDIIRLNDILLLVPLYAGAQWDRDKPDPVEQPVSATISIFYDVSKAALGDDLTQSLNYAVVSKKIRASVTNVKSLECLQDLARHISRVLAEILEHVLEDLDVHIQVTQLKAPLHVKSVSVECLAKLGPESRSQISDAVLSLNDLICPAIIGVNPAERRDKQDVVVNLKIATGSHGILLDDEWLNFRLISDAIYQAISNSDFQTLEALTSFVASKALSFLNSFDPSPTVTVRVAKPSALVFAASSEVELQRTREDYAVEALSTLPKITRRGCHIVAIAFGSNLGDSIRNIEYALRLLEVPLQLMDHGSFWGLLHPYLAVIDTSFLYETQPMYVADQPSFINGACLIETDIAEATLLRLLKRIEKEVGRVPSERNGPRAIDLDIIFYDGDVFDSRRNKEDPVDGPNALVIPHPRVQERVFVLRPLCDMIPHYVHPTLKKTVETLLNDIVDPSTPQMKKLIPFPGLHIKIPSVMDDVTFDHVPHTRRTWKHSSFGPHQTHVMATVNATPDSFSDGGDNNTIPVALSYISSAVQAGATIIDVGGYSTRPGADFVSVDDEIDRVCYLIRAIRGEDHENPDEQGPDMRENPLGLSEAVIDIPVSVDTFRWEVADMAIRGGANCINDVYAFSGPDAWPPPQEDAAKEKSQEHMDNMKEVTMRFMTPVILMHSRGDAGKNKDYSAYNYAKTRPGSGSAVLEGVRVELGEKVDRIVKGRGGIRRWLVIVDPGIGFSKTLEGNSEVLRSAQDVVADVYIGAGPAYKNPLRGFPQLIGASRKSFLGAILATEPSGRETQAKERKFATAAAVTYAVQQNALVVRVHDVQEMMDVVKVAKALYQ
ncbi:Dihydropteroate synthase-like protein [Crepidotus variabilis]|uniref:2-amino-4-hydroxy-6-hydroxymethyldihydropteridine diphosphokinase n=1 Tax=Crepidotus variabilis TaxID=179855 RepID=A0A9P6JS73_9AGAR|nr:Dihydropteroate synthase-like protein [Crepidotus variabilis]